jgi:hypothetical protein
LCDKGEQQRITSSSSSTSADPRAQALYTDILGRAANVANTPYQQYTGQLVAPINAQQQQGIAGVNANAGFASPYIQQAAGFASNAANPLSQQQIESYLNPYTQNVVDATQAQFNAQNRTQQQDLTGNLIAQGALGGNRNAVLQAELAGQQQRAQNPVIAGLYSTGYGQALNTAAQQYQQNPLAQGQALAGYGIQGQQAALAGAGQQIGAGNLMYQQQQAQNDAAYKQFQQQQAYPFQTTQWQAGLAGALAPQYGSSSTGQSTATQPEQSNWAQIAGLGLSAASLFSDERMKEDISEVGTTKDGQPIYRYRYKGSPQWHIGLIAQDVEQSHPEAVEPGFGGMKMVNMKTATDDAVERAHGGPVPGFAAGGMPVMPYSGADSWVPEANIQVSRGPSAPNMPEAGFGQQDDGGLGKLGEQAMGFAKEHKGMFGKGALDILPSGLGFSPSSVGTSFAGGSGGANILGGFYAAGGSVPDEDPGFIPNMANGGFPEEEIATSFNDRALPAERAITEGIFDPQGPISGTTFAPTEPGTPGFAPPMPRERPPGADQEPPGALPPQITGPTDFAQAGSAGPATGFAPEGPGGRPPQPFARDVAGAGFAPSAQPSGASAPANTMGGFNPLGLSDNARMALIAAGLATAASRSRNPLRSIGEGGLAGFGAYGRGQAQERQQVAEAQKLARDAEKAAQELSLRTRQQSETERHNRATEGKRTWGIIGEDKLTGRKVYGWIDPSAATAPAMPEEATAAPESLTPEAYLKTLPPDDAALVKKVAAYEIDPKTLSLRGGHRERILAAASRVNPAFDQSLYPQRYAVQKDFTSGKSSQNLSAFNTAIGHLDSLDKSIDKLGNYTSPIVNKITGRVSEQWDTKYQEALKEFRAAKTAVADELTRAFRGSGGNVHDIIQWEKAISEADSPQALHAAVRTAVELLNSRIEAVGDSYNRGMGTTKEGLDLLSPKAKAAVKRLERAGGAETRTTTLPAKGATADQPKPKRVIQNGVTYEQQPDGQYKPVQP